MLKRKAKPSRRPERFVYELTPRGEAKFSALLEESFLNFKRPQFSLDLSLFFLNYIKPKIAQNRLRTRLRVLDKLTADLRRTIESLKKKKPSSWVYILEHDLQMVETESKFLSDLIKNF